MNSLITDDQVYVVFIFLTICNLVTGMTSQTNQLADSQLVDKDNSHKNDTDLITLSRIKYKV